MAWEWCLIILAHIKIPTCTDIQWKTATYLYVLLRNIKIINFNWILKSISDDFVRNWLLTSILFARQSEWYCLNKFWWFFTYINILARSTFFFFDFAEKFSLVSMDRQTPKLYKIFTFWTKIQKKIRLEFILLGIAAVLRNIFFPRRLLIFDLIFYLHLTLFIKIFPEKIIGLS